MVIGVLEFECVNLVFGIVDCLFSHQEKQAINSFVMWNDEERDFYSDEP